jgi:hypothetical protein
VDDELEKMWKEVTVDYFKALSQNISAGAKKCREKPQDSSNSNRIFVEYEAGELVTQP